MISIDERADRVLEHARMLAILVESWADYCNELFHPVRGFVHVMFTNEAERRAFRLTPQYRKVRAIQIGLMQKFGWVEGARPLLAGR
jgi:hypothetical protein